MRHPYAQRFQDLIAYRKARELSLELFRASKAFPREEVYSLTDQIRRASRSIGAHIAEAWGKRKYARHFASKLTDADSEQLETQHWIETAQDCGYLDEGSASRSKGLCEELGKILGVMIFKAETFCGGSDGRVREDPAAYGLSVPSRKKA